MNNLDTTYTYTMLLNTPHRHISKYYSKTTLLFLNILEPITYLYLFT